MKLTIRPNEFTQPDYTITYIADDGRRLAVGRIFRASAGVPAATPWVWTVEYHQRAGRAGPYDGHTADFEAAKAAWKRCWESADVPINWPRSVRED
jgi:hypothetical protein